MKKFFTIIPGRKSSDLKVSRYTAVDNQKLQMEHGTRFPITAAMEGYLQEGDEFAIVAVLRNVDLYLENLELFKKEVEAVCQLRGARCVDFRTVWIDAGQEVGVQLDIFQKLIDCVNDGDELYSSMTYGTKPQSRALMMAVQYAYRIKKNCTIECILYGEFIWGSEVARIYDMTALIQMDEIVRMLADRGVTDPKATIKGILSL